MSRQCCTAAVRARDIRWLKAMGAALDMIPSEAIASLRRRIERKQQETSQALDTVAQEKMRLPSPCIVVEDRVKCPGRAVFCQDHAGRPKRPQTE